MEDAYDVRLSFPEQVNIHTHNHTYPSPPTNSPKQFPTKLY